MSVMTGGQALVQSIKNHGVETIFGIPGVQLDYAFNALYDERDSIRVIHPRHEQATAYMAFGYAQSTGRVGTCLVVPGPGLLNTAAALATAYSCGAPVLCLTGQIPSQFIGRGLGFLHEVPDQQIAMASVTKWQGRAETAAAAPGVVAEAFRQLNSGRRRPVLVEMAPDVMKREGDVQFPEGVESESAASDPEPDPDLIERAAAILGAAENPAIFVGGGVFGAEEELLRLAQAVEAPIIMSQNGGGAIDSRHYLAQTMVGAAAMWPRVDAVLAVGTRFVVPMIDWGYDDGIKLIRIDPDPGQSVDPWRPDVHIATLAKPALAALAERIGRHNRKRASRKEEYETIKKAAAKRFAKALPPQHEFCMAIRDVLPDDGIACFDLTQLGYYSYNGFPAYGPRTILRTGYQGTLGFGFPAALGAQVANPDKKTVCITGDGGFMFAVQEMATAVQHGINLVTVVMNDDAFGNVRRYQRGEFEGRVIASEFRNPDFLKLADSFGMMGLRAENPQDLGAALEKGFAADAPVLIEVPVGEFPDPFPYLRRQKVR